MAVFEDGKQDSGSQLQSIGAASFKNGSNAGRYAQLLNENRQVIYVSLTSKGKFYEIEDSNHGASLQRAHSLDANANGGATAAGIAKPKQDFADCVHRIANIVPADLQFPITVRFIAGQQGTTAGMPDTITISKVTVESCVIACPIEEPEARSPLHLRKLILTPEMRFIKSYLGFENEVKMFSNPNVQNILKYCQFNCDTFTKSIDIEYHPVNKANGIKHKSDALKILRPLNFPKLLRREKTSMAHEKEDSIIFLSKNDLENMDNGKEAASSHPEQASNGIFNDKMKVFQSTKKKWFRNLKSNAKDTNSLEHTDLQTKRMSLDRYQDMSKLLQERFGGDVEIDDKAAIAARADVDARRATLDAAELRQKSMSLQEIDAHSDYSMKPDLVNIEFAAHDGGHPADMDLANGSEDDTTAASYNPRSYITEKLCAEFQATKKSQSKSSSHIQQLISAPSQKMCLSDKRKSSEESLLDKPLKPVDFMIGSASVDDDLPYSSVRDSLVYPPANDGDANAVHNNNNNNIETNSNSENIYAEICPEGGVTGVTSSRHRGVSTCSSQGTKGAIRISVDSSNSMDGTASSSLRHTSTSSSLLSDNIYNTLK